MHLRKFLADERARADLADRLDMFCPARPGHSTYRRLRDDLFGHVAFLPFVVLLEAQHTSSLITSRRWISVAFARTGRIS